MLFSFYTNNSFNAYSWINLITLPGISLDSRVYRTAHLSRDVSTASFSTKPQIKTHDQEAMTILLSYHSFMSTMQQFQDCSPLLQNSNMEGKRTICKISWRLNAKYETIEFACVCVNFRLIDSTVESAHFIKFKI